MVVYVPRPRRAGARCPVRQCRRAGGGERQRRAKRDLWWTASSTDGRKTSSGEQGTEPALVGEDQGVAEVDRPRGAAQGGDPRRVPRALYDLLAALRPSRVPAGALPVVASHRR